MLETQTQIIGAGCDMPAEERIAWLQIYCDSAVLGKDRCRLELDRAKELISDLVCRLVDAEIVSNYKPEDATRDLLNEAWEFLK